MNVSENFMIMVNMATVFTVLYWTIKTFLDWRRFRSRIDLHAKLIDKFANVQELGSFLQTESGSKLIGVTSTEKVHPTREKLLSSITKATVLLSLGSAFLIISNMYALDDRRAFAVMAIIAIALGLAFIISTVISFILSKKWGIINGD